MDVKKKKWDKTVIHQKLDVVMSDDYRAIGYCGEKPAIAVAEFNGFWLEIQPGIFSRECFIHDGKLVVWELSLNGKWEKL